MLSLTNLIIGLLCLSSIINFHPLILGSLLCAIIFVIPGMAWEGICRSQKKKTLLEHLFYWLLISSLVLILGIAIHVIFNIKIGSRSYAYYLFFVNNSAFAISYFRGRRPGNFHYKAADLKKVIAVFLLIFFLLLLFNYLAVYIIPPLQDNTLTTQATAYGLSRHFTPKTFTDRYICYGFAHPLLHHFYTAASVFLTGHLEDLKYYYDYANKYEKLQDMKPYVGQQIDLFVQKFGRLEVKVKEIAGNRIYLDKNVPSVEPNTRLKPVGRFCFIRDNNIIEDYIPTSDNQLADNLEYEVVKRGEYWSMAREVYRKFYNNPYLFSSRLPNIFFTVMSCWVIYCIFITITGSKYLSLAGVLSYISIPELLVRSIGGSYSSITLFSIMVIAYFYIRNQYKALFWAALFGALANHKVVIILISIGLLELFKKALFRRDNGFWPAVSGFAMGTILFWIYGLIVNRQAFLLDHFHYHLFNRIFHISDFGYSGYPSIGELWSEFTRNVNPFFVFPALLGTGFAIFRTRTSNLLIFPLWFVFTGVIFSFIDWRGTKHLLLAVPALLISFMMLVNKTPKLGKVWFSFIFLGITVNIAKLMYFIYTKNLFIIASQW